ncbi:MAG: hypothetical protein WDM77_19755 [Steroidobacteraceae bacterium]
MTSNRAVRPGQTLVLEVVLDAEIDLGVVGQAITVRDRLPIGKREVGAQTGPQQHVEADPRALPQVGEARGTGQLLLVIKVDVVIGDVAQFIGVKIELAGNDVLADGAL